MILLNKVTKSVLQATGLPLEVTSAPNMVFLFLNMLANNAIKLGFFHNLTSAPSVKKDAAESAAPDDPSVKSNNTFTTCICSGGFLPSHLTSQCVCDAS